MWESLKIRGNKGLCLTVFQTERKGISQHFCRRLAGSITLAVFIVTVLFSHWFSLHTLEQFSPYDKSSTVSSINL